MYKQNLGVFLTGIGICSHRSFKG